MRDALNYLLVVISLGSALFAAFLGFHEYREYRQTLRVDRTLAYYERITGDEYYRNAGLIYQDFSYEAFAVPGQQYEDFVIREIEARDDLKQSVQALIGFYDALAVCVNLELCDAASASEYFLGEMTAFRNNVHPWIADQRRTYRVRAGERFYALIKTFEAANAADAGAAETGD